MVVLAAKPQRQPATLTPAVAAVNVDAPDEGSMEIVLPPALPPRPAAGVVAVITPVALTLRFATYLLAALVPKVQPQASLSAAGNALPDWKTSVTEVRQEDIAKSTSDTLARTV